MDKCDNILSSALIDTKFDRQGLTSILIEVLYVLQIGRRIVLERLFI